MPILIGLTAFADTNLELLKSIGLSDLSIDWIKFIGIVAALFLPAIPSIFKKEGDELPPVEDDGIGGGGIKNPPKP